MESGRIDLTAFRNERDRGRGRRVITRVVPSMKRGGVKKRIFNKLLRLVANFELLSLRMIRRRFTEHSNGKMRGEVPSTPIGNSPILAHTSFHDPDASRGVGPRPAAVNIDNHAIPQQELPAVLRDTLIVDAFLNVEPAPADLTIWPQLEHSVEEV